MSTDSHDAVEVLSRALDQAGDVIAAVEQDDLAKPTPCGDWDVARLMAHLLASPPRFVEAARGGQPDWGTDPDLPPGDPATNFRAAAANLVEVWQEAGAEANPGQVDWTTAEIAVHTWDLARATGQSPPLDSEVAERGLAFMSAGLTTENRGAAFAPPVPVADDAPVYDRLAAWAGRDPR